MKTSAFHQTLLSTVMASLLLALAADIRASPRPVAEGETTFRQDLQPIWQARCIACHGPEAPSAAAFEADEDRYAALGVGPRMAGYTDLLQFVIWPDTGALMRRLDDGSNTPDGKPGNMYQHLGPDEDERQRNLAVFKAWVGEGGWTLKRWNEISKAELDAIRALE